MVLERTIELTMALLFGVVAITTLARRLEVPYPSLLVLGGLAVALVPGVPTVELPPDLVLLLFLPPLIFGAGWSTSWHDLKANAGSITSLAVGLVAATTLGVGLAVHLAVPSLPLVVCFVLGAIVSPTDAIAANTIAGKVGLPHRLASILEGESLANDATGLVVYRFAVAAALTGQFSPAGALASMALASLGGAAFGLLVGFLLGQLQRHIDDPPVEITLQLLAAYAAYLPAEHLGLSGVFAAATAGLYSGWISPTVLRSRTRLDATAYWDTTEFLLNGLLFLLLGLQIRLILTDPNRAPTPVILASAAAVVGATILIRGAWVALSYGLEAVFRRPRLRPKAAGLLGWTGLRGVLSLATALALPFELAPGVPFPGRRLIILLAFSVILATLVLQGLLLPALIRRLTLRDEEPADDRQEDAARLRALRAAHLRLADLIGTLTGPEIPAANELRRRLEIQLEQLSSPSPLPLGASFGAAAEREAFFRIRRELIAVERQELLALRRAGHLDDHALRRIERDLDLDEIRG